MEFNITQDAAEGTLKLVALPGDYDAIPVVSEVDISAVPLNQHPDRLAVALCLLFGNSISGVFKMPGNGCSPHVASAIQRFLEPVAVHVFPVNTVPQRNAVGERDGQLDVGVTASRGGAEKCACAIRIGNMDQLVGSMASSDEISVSSNAGMLTIGEPSLLRKALPKIGVAVLFCEDLMIGRVLLPKEMVQQAGGEEAERLRRLLDSCALCLAWT